MKGPPAYTLVASSGNLVATSRFCYREGSSNEVFPFTCSMLIGILVKTLFAGVVWFLVLDPFVRKGRLVVMLIRLTCMIVACLSIEIFLSWQFQAFHLSHMISHQSSVIWVNLALYLGITMIMMAIAFARQWIENERKQRELTETKLTTELAYLRSQINPHFLFNTLNNIFSIAQRDKNEEVAMSISRLSGLMRYTLNEGSNNFVSLKTEIDHLQDFIGLARMRYTSEEANVNFMVSGDVEDVLIAPMILSPFIENAFKYGVKIHEHSAVEIQITVSNKEIRFLCRNAIYKTEGVSNDSSGIGLLNVKRRIELLYPGRNSLNISDSGACFVVDLVLR